MRSAPGGAEESRSGPRVTGVSTGAPFAFQSGMSAVEADGIDDRAGQDVRADLRALLEHDDGQLAPGFGGELLQADRGGQARRARADDHHVVLHRLAWRQLRWSERHRSPLSRAAFDWS